MDRSFCIKIICLVCSFYWNILNAEKVHVELKNGGSIRGDLLKNNSEYLVLDLGFDLLKIPQSHCLKVLEESVDGNESVISPGKNLYYESPDAVSQPLGKLVARLGESVVMIRTPIGLGSGFIIHPDGYVVTNDHVVAGERIISVTRFRKDKNELVKENYDNVRIVATGGNIDLALLKIEVQAKKIKFPS